MLHKIKFIEFGDLNIKDKYIVDVLGNYIIVDW